MALVDLIASSGSRNFEKMRKGWLPTAQETNARKMSELGIQQRQQQVDYEPERQRQVRKRQKQSTTQAEQTTELFEQKMKKYETTQQVDEQKRFLDFSSRIVRGAYSVMGEKGESVEQARAIFRQNLNGLLEANDEKGDEIIKKFVDPNTSDKEAIQILKNFNSVMPLAQEALDKQRLGALRGMGTLYERLQSKVEDGTATEQDNKTLQKLSGEKSSKEYNQTLSFKEKKERKKGMAALTKNYKNEYKPFIHTKNQITKIKNALKSGDNAVMDIQVTTMLTNIEASPVKAKSMYDIHNAPLGNIMERIKDEVSRFIGGVKTDKQKEQILSAINDLEKYNNLVVRDGEDKYRSMARKNKYDVGLTIPYNSFEAVQRDYKRGYLTKDEAIQYLKENKRLIKK